MQTRKIEFWVSPEMASEVGIGTIITMSVDALSKVGNGYLVEAEGVFVKNSTPIKGDTDKEVPLAEDVDGNNYSLSDLSGASKPIQSFVSPSVEDVVPESTENVEAVSTSDKKQDGNENVVAEAVSTGISFGERGPQLIGGDSTPIDIPEVEDAEVVKEAITNPSPKLISDIRGLYEYLKSLDPELLKKSESSGPVPRDEAVALEGSGRIGCGMNAFIKNVSGGQLVLSDIDVRIRHGDSYNLGRVNPAFLLSSVDLFEAVNGKLITFIDGDEARRLNDKTERRLAAIEEDLHSVEVYDDIDSVYDDIDGDYDEEDLDPRVRHSNARVKQQATVDNRFRRGIKSASQRRSHSDDGDYAAVETPEQFRDVERMDVMKKDDGYEFDRIFDDLGKRESEISSMEGSIDWQGDTKIMHKESSGVPRDHVKVNKRI